MKRTVLLAIAIIVLINIKSAGAQSSVSIGEGYDCQTDIDGSRTLGKLEKNGFRKVKFSAVDAKIDREQLALDAKEDKLQLIVKGPKSFIDRLLLKFIQSFVKKYPASDISAEFDDKETRNAVVRSTKAYIKKHRSELRAVLKRARACKGGTTSPPQNGSIISPTLKLVSFRGTQTAYAGFLLLTKPRIVKFATKPGGFNVCTRIESIDPTTSGKIITGTYTGVGEDLCYIGSGVVDDSAVAACNATLPSGFVGYFLKGAQGDDLSDQGLKNLESLLVESPPTVHLLALDQFSGSRDAAVARCEQFKK